MWVHCLSAPPVADDSSAESEDLQAANPCTVLLRTFLPWINAGQVPDYERQHDEEGPNDGRDEPESSLAGAVEAEEGVTKMMERADAAAHKEKHDLD